MKIKKYKKIFWVFFLHIILIPVFLYAESPVNLIGPNLLPRSEIFITPQNQDVVIGSMINVPIYLDTLGYDINAINLKISFDSTKLIISNPSVGKSILGIWVEPFKYDNAKGTASLMGVIPNGIVTRNGLIATLTFKTIKTGKAGVSVTDYSSANLNDGFGSNVSLTLKGSVYNIIPSSKDSVDISTSSTSTTQEANDLKVTENKPSKNNYQVILVSVFDWNVYYILIVIIVLLLLWIFFHYLFGHYFKKENKKE